MNEDKVIIGACAVGTPNGLTFFRGYVDFRTSDDKMTWKRLWCSKRRLAWETARDDAQAVYDKELYNELHRKGAI